VQSVRRPSAALVLGAMAGAMAALSFIPTAVPLIWQIIRAEEVSGLRHTTAVAFATQSSIASGVSPDEGFLARNGVGHISMGPPGQRQQLGTAFPDATLDEVCATVEGAAVVQYRPRQMWAVTCIEANGLQVAAGVPLDPRTQAQRVLALVLLLAVFVGIITALGILRLLGPLSEVSRALARVGAGERGVAVPQTGLAELDELVDRLNAAARSVDDREDAILSRIEVVQEMARIVAHEIRNPLQSLELLTSLIASEEDDNERLEIGHAIHSEIRSLEQVVHRLLRESAVKGSLRLQISTQPIAPLLEQVVALRRPQANGQGVRITIAALSWTEAAFDHALLKRSIENLVLNALQAVPRGTGEVRLSVTDDGDGMLIAVDDNGPGVPEELVDHIFERNVTHGKKEGLGIGLALVKGVIEAHGGYIRYQRSALGGARFEARIPLVQSERAEDTNP
jgi:signal transduction histidine kinase